MNISSLSTSSLFSTIGSSSITSSGSCQSSDSTSSASSTSDSASVSGPGKLMSELKQLSESDPTEFKKIAGEIATQLQSAASKSSDSNESTFLQNMASNFEKASQSGNFSDLFPQQSSGQSGTSQASGSSTAQQAYQSAPPPSHNGGNDTASTIFANALSQIQTDLGTSSSTSS